MSSVHADRRVVTRNSDSYTDGSGDKSKNSDEPYGGGTSAGRSSRESKDREDAKEVSAKEGGEYQRSGQP
jgi:hypothetical protein